jgi:hypothetical protein
MTAEDLELLSCVGTAVSGPGSRRIGSAVAGLLNEQVESLPDSFCIGAIGIYSDLAAVEGS